MACAFGLLEIHSALMWCNNSYVYLGKFNCGVHAIDFQIRVSSFQKFLICNLQLCHLYSIEQKSSHMSVSICT